MIAVVWMIIWSFCHHEVCCSRLWWYGPFSGLSVTVRTSVTDGSDMDHFLIFSVTMRCAAADGGGIDYHRVDLLLTIRSIFNIQ